MKYRLLIKEYRKQRRLTQMQLAKKAGLNQSYISQLERNLPHAKSPTLNTLFKIAAALEVCPQVLVTTEHTCDRCCVKICPYI